VSPAPLIVRLAERGRVFYAFLEGDGRIREAQGDLFTGLRLDPGAPAHAADGVEWLTPCDPRIIVGVGRNYREHAAELRHAVPTEPLIFLKPSSAVLPDGGTIRLPAASRRVDYEGELGVVIGRPASRVPEERALGYVLGYVCVNDVTARDLQEQDVQFTRAKGFDSFCPFGPGIATGLRPEDLAVETWVNGCRRQAAPVGRMIFGVARLISYISHVMTLRPGDLIATGTPEGVGPLHPGDEVTVAIAGIGRLTNRVAAA
jgi:2-keto-4-pentenoate hydratase/2-oxohepta-3-ene-1,7-dioic acid hydratase in catechol pathway